MVTSRKRVKAVRMEHTGIFSYWFHILDEPFKPQQRGGGGVLVVVLVVVVVVVVVKLVVLVVVVAVAVVVVTVVVVAVVDVAGSHLRGAFQRQLRGILVVV